MGVEESIKKLEDKLQESENRLEDEIERSRERLEERAREISALGSVKVEIPTQKLQKKQEIIELHDPMVADTSIMEVKEEMFQAEDKSKSCEKSGASSVSADKPPEEELSREEKASRRRVALRRRNPISRASLVQT